jgi:hypothetical protein
MPKRLIEQPLPHCGKSLAKPFFAEFLEIFRKIL